MSQPLLLLIDAVAAAVLAFGLCRVVMAWKIMDAPTEARHVQKAPVPSAGGLGVAAAMFVVLIATSMLTSRPFADTLVIAAGGALAILALGFGDDTMELPALSKLIVLSGISLFVVAFSNRPDVLQPWPGVVVALPLAVALAGSVLWIVVIVNAVNFMDGANGLSMGMAAVAALGLAICAAIVGTWDIALAAAALAGALCGFLYWNISGRLFVGDTGALFTGAVLGLLGLDLVHRRPDLLFIPPMLMMPYLSDALLTLAWRTRHGKKLFVAHRDHVYQIAMKAGLKHWQVALVHAFWAANAAIFAILAAALGGEAPPLLFLLLLLVSTWIHWRIRRSGVTAGLVGADIP